MTDYTKLVQALRCKRDDCEGCDLSFFDKDEGWMCQYAAKDYDAADAIEALDRLLDQNTKRCEALRKQMREAHESYERHLNELKAQLPKRGEWVMMRQSNGGHYKGCSACHAPMPTDTMLDYLDDADCKWCYSCGAKMEVQG